MHHKILTRLISNHSDIQAHFIARFDYVNFKLLLSAQIERLVQIKFRRIYRSLRYTNLKAVPTPCLYLGAEAPYLYNVALGFGQIHYFHIAMPRLRHDKILRNHR